MLTEKKNNSVLYFIFFNTSSLKMIWKAEMFSSALLLLINTSCFRIPRCMCTHKVRRGGFYICWVSRNACVFGSRIKKKKKRDVKKNLFHFKVAIPVYVKSGRKVEERKSFQSPEPFLCFTSLSVFSPLVWQLCSMYLNRSWKTRCISVYTSIFCPFCLLSNVINMLTL